MFINTWKDNVWKPFNLPLICHLWQKLLQPSKSFNAFQDAALIILILNLNSKYIIFRVFYQIWCLAAFVKVGYALFICQDIIFSKITWSVEMVTFNQSKLRSFDYLAWRHMKICYYLILICICFNKLRDHMAYRNDI